MKMYPHGSFLASTVGHGAQLFPIGYLLRITEHFPIWLFRFGRLSGYALRVRASQAPSGLALQHTSARRIAGIVKFRRLPFRYPFRPFASTRATTPERSSY